MQTRFSSTFCIVATSDSGALPPQGMRDPAPSGAHNRASGPKNAWTVSQVLQWTVQRFTTAGLDSPRVDAEYLLAHALECARVELYVRYDMLIGADERARFRELVRRRLAHEPVAYIEGMRGFHALDLELSVDRRVLVPRPETELLVDWVLERLPADTALTLLDVGTGSGAIALSIKRARPQVLVTASDISADALEVARGNAERADLALSFATADLYEGVETPDGGWSAIVSNPPYIDTDVLDGLAPEVRAWEPTLALDGGPDGLDVVRRLVAGAAQRLAPGGLLGIEIGFDQHERVVPLFREGGLTSVETRKDHSDHVRMVMGHKPGQKLGPSVPD